MRANQLYRYAAIVLLVAAAPLYLVRDRVPAFAWLSPLAVTVGCFSLMAAKQGPAKAAVGFGKRILLYIGIWILICAGLIVYWLR